MPWGQHLWEHNAFSGENLGRVIAEIDLRHEHERRQAWNIHGAGTRSPVAAFNLELIALVPQARQRTSCSVGIARSHVED
jgi:CYTH domain-containing protein